MTAGKKSAEAGRSAPQRKSKDDTRTSITPPLDPLAASDRCATDSALTENFEARGGEDENYPDQGTRFVEEAVLEVEDLRRRKREERVDRLRRRLRGTDHVGAAFRRLVAAKCDGTWLEDRIALDWRIFPWQQDSNLVAKEQIKKIQTAAGMLRKQADKLEPFLPVLSGRIGLTNDVAANALWSAGRDLRQLADHLDFACEQSAGRYTTIFVARRRISYVIGEVRRSTGKPHFEDLATLYGAAYDRIVSADDLKMMEVREHLRTTEQ